MSERRLMDEELESVHNKAVREEAGGKQPCTWGNVRLALAELRDLRGLLATKYSREVTFRRDHRDRVRVEFELGDSLFVVDGEKALALGVALVRAALAAKGQK